MSDLIVKLLNTLMLLTNIILSLGFLWGTYRS